jgi:stage V sporulation protein SpoVS
MEVLKVSAKSSPNSVAGALAGVLREKGAAEIQAIGAGHEYLSLIPVGCGVFPLWPPVRFL